jgi:hypothetical protein
MNDPFEAPAVKAGRWKVEAFELFGFDRRMEGERAKANE